MRVLLILLLTCTVQAEDLLEIYQAGQENDQQLQAAIYNFKATQENIPQAKSLKRPSFALSAGYTLNYADIIEADYSSSEIDDTYGTGNFAAQLKQNIYSKYNNISINQAVTTVEQGEITLDYEKQDLILRVAEAYFNILSAQDTLRSTEAEKEAISQQLEQAQKRFEVGLIAITDVREAQASYDSAVSSEIVAQNALETAIEALAVIVGQEYRDLYTLQEDLPLNPPEPNDIATWVDTAKEQNLNLIATRIGVEIAKQEVDKQKATISPTVDVVGGYNYSQNDGYAFSSTQKQHGASVGIELNIPFDTSGLNRSQIRQALYQLEQNRSLLLQQERLTTQQTRDAFRGIIASISQVNALKQALLSSQTALEATQAGFEVGTRTTVDVLIALQDLYNAERNLAQARYDYILNTLRLKQAAGILNEADLEETNNLLIP